MHSSPLLSELIVIREWLQDTAPIPTPAEATTGYWKFTKYDLVQNLRVGKGKEKDGTVVEMDPDAVHRGDGHGQNLAADDAVSPLLCCREVWFILING